MLKFVLLTTFLFLSGSAVADIVAPSCSLSLWTFNSLGQNACIVAAYLLSTCYQGSADVVTLPPGAVYYGPTAADHASLCYCNTITYSLLSACADCQGAGWISWSLYSFNCTNPFPPSTFPNPVPAGTRVPRWALLDPTLENYWNNVTAMATGDSPEVAAGAIIGPSNTSSSSYSSGPASTSASSVSSMSSSPTTKGSSSNVGTIAGSVVGCIAVISITVFAVFYFKRRPRESNTFEIDVTSPPTMRDSLPAGPSRAPTLTPWTPAMMGPYNTRAKKFAKKFVRNPGPTPPPSYGTRSLA